MEVGCNGCWDGFVTVIAFVSVIVTPHGDPLLSGFVGLQREEAIRIKKTVMNSPLLQREERKNRI